MTTIIWHILLEQKDACHFMMNILDKVLSYAILYTHGCRNGLNSSEYVSARLLNIDTINRLCIE